MLSVSVAAVAITGGEGGRVLRYVDAQLLLLPTIVGGSTQHADHPLTRLTSQDHTLLQ